MNDEMSKDLIERLLDNRVTGFNLTVAAVEAANLIEAQAAQIELLHTTIRNFVCDWDLCGSSGEWPVRSFGNLRKIAESTPKDALQAFAEKVREYCAEICDEIGDCDNGYRCAKEIRAIKELPK